MNVTNYYWYFTSAVPPKICDDIIKHGLSQSETMARTGAYENKKLNKDEIKNMQKKENQM